MAAVDRYLDTELGSLVSYPPYSTYYSNIGDMTQKPPGVHENGGVYLHPMAWKLAVELSLIHISLRRFWRAPRII